MSKKTPEEKDITNINDIPEFIDVLPDTTEKIDFKNAIIDPKQMAWKAYHCACNYRKIIRAMLYDCPTIDNILYVEYLTSFMGIACEIYLKSLLYYQQSSDSFHLECGHKLIELFEQLEKTTQDLIAKVFCAKEEKYNTDSFIETLKRNSEAFILYRYAYELKSMSIELHFMIVLMDVLLEVSKSIIIDSQSTDKNMIK